MKNIDKNDLKNILKSIYEAVKVNDQQNELFKSIITDTELEEINEEEKSIIISLISPFYKTIIESNFKTQISDAIEKILKDNFQVKFMLKNEYNKYKRESINKVEKEVLEEDDFKLEENNSLKEKLIFENYVVSSSNKMIHSAALSVSLNPGGPWNPLFIFGGSGLGKTHLLHAIGNYAKNNFPNFNVKYIQAKDFGELVHQAIKSKNPNNNLDYIKKTYEKYNMLLVDDVQFIQTWNKAKEIFFNIFNYFIENDKQVVITSDTYPQELDNFEQRFITRFEKGLTIGVLPPDFEGAKDIIKLKIKQMHDFDLNFFEEEIIDYLANNFSTNVRELEGSINRIIFWTINSDVEKITLNDIKIIFKNHKSKRETLNIDQIINSVSEYYSISSAQIFGNGRTKEVLLSRQISIYLGRNLLNLSLIELGKKFNKNHSTILNSINKIERQKEINKNLNLAIYKIRAQILK